MGAPAAGLFTSTRVAHPPTHPSRLAAHAVLLGLEPANADGARILEIGCGSGANLLPMAAAMPSARLLGIDTSERDIRAGRAALEDLGLRNLDLRHATLTDVAWNDVSDGTGFDYVIADGVYSNLASADRGLFAQRIASLLSPHGVAFVSYRCYPGAYAGQALREACLLHAGFLEDVEQRAEESQSLLRLLACQPEASWLRPECGRLLALSTAEFGREELGEHTSASYFFQFARHALQHGLQFLAESSFGGSSLFGLPRDAAERLEGLIADNPLAVEQYLDLLRMRRVRETLLCRADVFVDRQARLGRVEALWAASSARRIDRLPQDPDNSTAYALADGSRLAVVDSRLCATLDTLAGSWPHPVRIRNIDCDRKALLDLHGAGFVDLQAWAPSIFGLSDRPSVPQWIRWQAAQGCDLTNAYHCAVRIDDSFTRSLLSLLDGTRDSNALERALGRPVGDALREVAQFALLGG
ncbi:MAG: class I SAM-dependent methyltransferase [Bryobacteraceae bacterium]